MCTNDSKAIRNNGVFGFSVLFVLCATLLKSFAVVFPTILENLVDTNAVVLLGVFEIGN